MILAYANIITGVVHGTALPHQYISGLNLGTAEYFNTQSLTV